jgi:hypothetical protein
VTSKGAEVGADVFEGVWEATNAVIEGVSVRLGVHDRVIEGVREAVKVNDGVSVAGWKRVAVRVGEGVVEGVKVGVKVLVAVSVRVGGVGVEVEVRVRVVVGVTVGVRLLGEGRRAIAINPIQ